MAKQQLIDSLLVVRELLVRRRDQLQAAKARVMSIKDREAVFDKQTAEWEAARSHKVTDGR